MNDERVRGLLRGRLAPDEEAAQERAWRVVRAGFPAASAPPRRGQRRRTALALAALAVLAVLAVSGPGEAVADWVRDKIGREKEVTPPLASLPADGRLLVESGNGPWIVAADGSKRRLGSYEEASWSPHGLFVAVTRPGELLAVDPKGDVRWSLPTPAGPRAPRWSPDGFRIAYLSGGSVRVVAGDGSGDKPLGVAGSVAPAWRPGAAHRLAYAGPKGDLRVIDADSGRSLWRAFGGPASELLWSADGSRLLALAPDLLRIYDSRGRLVGTRALPRGTRAETAAFAPSGRTFALVTRTASTGGRVSLIRAGTGVAERRLFSGVGAFSSVAWSPDGAWLLVAWRATDQWLFINVPDGSGPPGKVVTFSDITRQFDSGIIPLAMFPRVAGWCCAR